MEKVLIIRKSDFKDKAEALDFIAEKLKFPSHFGRNLDALFDCLCDIDDRTIIGLDPAPSGDEDDWYSKICGVIADAADENDDVIVFVRLGTTDT